MRIALEIEHTLDLGALPRRIFLSRLWARVQFHGPTGWTDYHMAIVDTGAPYSLIPASLWPTVRAERLKDIPVRGIVPGKGAELDASLAKVRIRLLDEKRISPRLTLWAMLTKTDQVPLILGWSGCLDRASLVLDAPHHRAWLEF